MNVTSGYGAFQASIDKEVFQASVNASVDRSIWLIIDATVIEYRTGITQTVRRAVLLNPGRMEMQWSNVEERYVPGSVLTIQVRLNLY